MAHGHLVAALPLCPASALVDGGRAVASIRANGSSSDSRSNAVKTSNHGAASLRTAAANMLKAVGATNSTAIAIGVWATSAPMAAASTDIRVPTIKNRP